MNRPAKVPDEAWVPLDCPAWTIRGAAGNGLRLLGVLPAGIAGTRAEAIAEFLRRDPLVANALSASKREQLTATPRGRL